MAVFLFLTPEKGYGDGYGTGSINRPPVSYRISASRQSRIRIVSVSYLRIVTTVPQRESFYWKST